MKSIIANLTFIALFVCNTGYAVTNQWGIDFVEIPAGSFEMGLKDPWDVVDEMQEPDPEKFNDEMPRHTVHISKPFLLSKTEITQGQWLAIMNTKPGPEKNWNAKNWETLPVTGISWQRADSFVKRINEMDDTLFYRLPTEAEWEYAARAGSMDLRPIPLSQLHEYAWYIDNSNDHVHPVGLKKANKWGLHDMLGNLWEWTNDWYSISTYTKHDRRDPKGVEKGRSKVRRGGSFHCPLYQVRPSYRSANPTDVAYSVFGIRLVAVP